MNINEYLKEVKNATIEQLEKTYGIYDNGAVILNGDYGQVLNHVLGSPLSDEFFKGKYLKIREQSEEQYKDHPDYGNKLHIKNVFESEKGFVHFQLETPPGLMDLLFDGFDGKHFLRQKNGYNMVFCYHPSFNDEGVVVPENCVPAMLKLVEDVIQYGMKLKMPLCITRLGDATPDDPRGTVTTDRRTLLAPVYWP